MTKTLAQLGYIVQVFDNSRWPAEIWTKTADHGHWKQMLVFDTIHGGPWMFECSAEVFVYKDEENWTTQERIEFNPASHGFIGCNIGSWHRMDAILSADECMAVAERITLLESNRVITIREKV